MTINEARKRLTKAITELNDIQDSITFEVVETNYSIGFTNHGRVNKNATYGSYTVDYFFDEYKRKSSAYINAVQFAEVIISATKLTDPKAYHNFKEKQ